MKKYFTILFLISASLAMAQPKITRNEDFPIGLKLTFRNIAPSTLSTWKTGANQTWDFSSVTLNPDSSTELMTDPAWTADGKDYPTANLVEQYSDGSFVFVNKTDSANYLVGYTASGIKIQYPQGILFAKRPMTYLDSFTKKYTDSYDIQGYQFSFRGAGTINIVADGYGTLKLPGNSYNNVLRLKITEEQKDTALPGGAVSTTTIVSYVWFDETHYSALLKIDSTNSHNTISKTAEYLLQEAMSGIDQTGQGVAAPISANIRNNKLQIRSQLVQGEEYRIGLYNMLGQTIYNGRFTASGSPVETINIPSQLRGIFVLDLQGINTKVQGLKVIAQ